MGFEKALNFMDARNKVFGKFPECGSRPDDEKEASASPHHRIALVWLIIDSVIPGDGDPAPPAYFWEPDIIRSIVRKVLGVFFDFYAGLL